MYLNKEERRRIVEIVEIMAREVTDLMFSHVSDIALTKEEGEARMDGCHRATNEWLWELSTILVMPIKQVGREETHVGPRVAEEDDNG